MAMMTARRKLIGLLMLALVVVLMLARRMENEWSTSSYFMAFSQRFRIGMGQRSNAGIVGTMIARGINHVVHRDGSNLDEGVGDFETSRYYAQLPRRRTKQNFRPVPDSPPWMRKAIEAIRPYQVNLMCPSSDLAGLACHWKYEANCSESTSLLRASFVRGNKTRSGEFRAQYAYLPHIPKTGSSALKYFMLTSTKLLTRDITRNRVTEYVFFKDYRNFVENSRDIFTFTAVRDPLERAISSYGIIDQFFKFLGAKEKQQLVYHDMFLDKLDQGQELTKLEKMQRFYVFLEHTKEYGFWNWHVTPQVAAFAKMGDVSKYLHFVGSTSTMDFWMGNITTIGPNVRKWSLRQASQSHPIWGFEDTKQLRAAVKLTAKDILDAAAEHGPLAVRIVQLVCMIYALDYICLDMTIPSPCLRVLP